MGNTAAMTAKVARMVGLPTSLTASTAMADQLPPMIALEGLVALAVTYERLGQPGPSAARFRAACAIDRMQAIARYEYYRR